MSRRLAWFLSFAFAIAGAAHAAPQDAVPTASRYPVRDVNQVDTVLPFKLDLVRLAEEDAASDRKGEAPRFAVPQHVAITPGSRGTWEKLGDGLLLWRLRIIGGEGTTSLNLGFSRYQLTPNSRLLLYSTDGTQRIRPFTAADNAAHGELWTPVLATTDLIVELTVPRKERSAVELRLGSINQGYRGFGTTPGDPYLKSGSCNLDVACLATGDSWRQQMRAVAVISTGGSRFCSGSLINDTAGDRKMYFMTANHCGITSSNAASLVAFWNYQNSFCRTPGSAQSGQAGDGTLTQFHTGSFFRAANAPSDFTLVELDDPPVAAFNHFWAGWDRSTGDYACTAAAPCATIHHPNVEEKRITYVTTTTATTSFSGTTSPGDGTHVWAHWATDPPGPFTVPGVTEPGSSGSPLYSQAGRYIGQLHGGPSACGATGNNLSDYYGRFSVSWTGGGTNSTRLSNWLDAGNTGATAIDGLDGSGPCTPPAAPTGLTATATSQTQVNLTWNAVAGATSYTILRATTSGGPYAAVGTSTSTSFSNTGLTCNTTYFYVVAASNGGCSSGNSSQAQATTQACTACNAISDVEPNNNRTSPQVISGNCNQISGTFLNDSTGQQNDFFRISLPAGATVTALLNGLTVDYDVFIYNSVNGSAVASSQNGGTTPDQATYTNTSGAAQNVWVRAFRFSSTRTTYQLRISF
jgi:hypothetical protein